MSISSKFLDSIRNRDWGAAIIEIGIVAIGILMALAVDNWRAERENLEIEHAILSRTHEQIDSVQETIRGASEYREEFLSLLHNARNLVFEVIPNRALSDDECHSVVWSHKVEMYEWRLPSIEELLASGSLSAIQDASVREAALSFIGNRDEHLARARVWNAKTTNLSVEFADILLYVIVPTDDPADEDGFTGAGKCDLDGMRLDRKFRNALNDNLQYHIEGSRFLTRYLIPNMTRLHERLDARLGIVDH